MPCAGAGAFTAATAAAVTPVVGLPITSTAVPGTLERCCGAPIWAPDARRRSFTSGVPVSTRRVPAAGVSATTRFVWKPLTGPTTSQARPAWSKALFASTSVRVRTSGTTTGRARRRASTVLRASDIGCGDLWRTNQPPPTRATTKRTSTATRVTGDTRPVSAGFRRDLSLGTPYRGIAANGPLTIGASSGVVVTAGVTGVSVGSGANEPVTVVSSTTKDGPSPSFEPSTPGPSNPGVGASCQLNARPAKESNHASCCGHAVAGWSWRWRCGPVACPVVPDEPDRLARAELDSDLDGRLAIRHVAVRPALAVRAAEGEADPAPCVDAVPGVDDRAVLERVIGRALGRGDVDRRVVVVGVRGRDGLRAAADREDVAALVLRRDEGAARRLLRTRPGPRAWRAAASFGCAAPSFCCGCATTASCGVRVARRRMPPSAARSARSERSDAVCARAASASPCASRPRASTWRAAASLVARVDDRLRAPASCRPGAGRGEKAARVRSAAVQRARARAPRRRTSRRGCRRRRRARCPSAPPAAAR